MDFSKRPNEDAHQELYEAGMEIRRKVMGDSYVDNQLKKGVSEFMKPMQEHAAGLEPKQRSLINIALLASQGKSEELAGHVRGAIGNGATKIEIRETLLQTAAYCGIPTGMSSFRVAEEALKKMETE
ncbi:CMD-domain-containing protein [Mycena crocata]|nr:CMD-domain-containing protein [Mycena crocata]